MAQPRTHQGTKADPTRPRDDETSDSEHDRIRQSNDRDHALERGGKPAPHNHGNDKASQDGDARPDIDPDSAAADNDRDDMLTD